MKVTYSSDFPFIEDVKLPGYWFVTRGGVIRWENGTVTIPDRYLTDGASIPRPFWSVIYPVDARIRRAALGHDRLYETNQVDGGVEVSKDFADEVLFYGMESLGGSLMLRRAVWAAVQIGGAWAWRTGPERRVERLRKMKEFSQRGSR